MIVARSSGAARARGSVQVDRVAVGQDRPRMHVSGRSSGVAEHDDLVELGQFVTDLEEALEEALVLDDGDLRPTMVDEILDLVGGGRVVDRHRGGAEERDGDVDPVELGHVPHHDHDAVTGPDAQVGQPGGGPGDLPASSSKVSEPQESSPSIQRRAAVADRAPRRSGGTPSERCARRHARGSRRSWSPWVPLSTSSGPQFKHRTRRCSVTGATVDLTGCLAGRNS